MGSQNSGCGHPDEIGFSSRCASGDIRKHESKGGKKAAGADAVDLPNWLSKENRPERLQSTDLLPWHIVLTYDQFDEDGDNVHSGVYEEYWAAAKKYKRIYKSD